MNIFEKLGIDISPKNKDNRGFFRGLITEFESNVRRYNSPEVQNYFHTLVAAMMLEYHKAYETYEIKVPYRIKSAKSVFDKIVKYMGREDKSEFVLNEHGELQGRLKEDIADMMAFTIVGCNRPSTFYSKDPEINELILEKKRNHALLGEMQKFRLNIVKEEFSGKANDVYDYTCTKKDYYMNCIMLLERIKTLIDPKATNLMKVYDDLLDKVKATVPEKFFSVCDTRTKEVNDSKTVITSELLTQSIAGLNDLLRYSGMDGEDLEDLSKPITPEDTKNVDFLKLLDDFSSRIYDKLDLAILQKQVDSVFRQSELLSKFGVKLVEGKLKEKRTANGYVANFVYIDTPFGRIELQLQTQHENQEGNYGYAAHSNLKGKKFKEFDLPALDDEDGMKEFRTCVDFISPKKFLAQYDHLESERIIVQKFGDYQNYKALASQVKRGSEEDIRLQKYFGQLYAKRDQYFPNEDKNEKIESFIKFDIEDYLASPEFKKLMASAPRSTDDDEGVRE